MEEDSSLWQNKSTAVNATTNSQPRTTTAIHAHRKRKANLYSSLSGVVASKASPFQGSGLDLCNSEAQHDNLEETERWSEDLHRTLVEAIYDIGVSHASPSVLMEHMRILSTESTESENNIQSHLTSERIKSHLQKYRKNKKKSKQDFCSEYNRWMQKALTISGGGISAASRTSLATNPSAILNMMYDVTSSPESVSEGDLVGCLLGGDLAAFLTFSIMLEDEQTHSTSQVTLHAKSSDLSQLDPTAKDRLGEEQSIASKMVYLPSAKAFTNQIAGASLQLPLLSEEEQLSSLGISISHVIGLFHSMSNHLMKERTYKLKVNTSHHVHQTQDRRLVVPHSSTPVIGDHSTDSSSTSKGQVLHHIDYSSEGLQKIIIPQMQPQPSDFSSL